MYKFKLTLFFILSHFIGSATNFYVKQGNSTANNGLTPATAVGLTANGTIPSAVLSTIAAGDFIYLMGVFTNPSYTTSSPIGVAVNDARFWHGENTFRINNMNGSPSGYITIKPYDNTTLLKGDGGNIIRIQNCSYLKIEGFNIQGEVDNLPLSVANALQFVYVVSNSVVTAPALADIKYRDQDCVSNCTAGAVVAGEVYSSLNPNKVYRPTYYDTRGMYLSDVHHIDILNNHIHHMPGGGLRVSDCEDILIEGNQINDCSRRSSGGTHGLVVTKATSTRTTDDYRIRIIRNLVHHNYNEQYSWAPDKIEITPHIDEGKGISLQRNQTTTSVNWDNGRILIANNICYRNGFSGIHSNDGDRIDIVNNTCYFNSYTGSITIGGTNPNGGNIGISISDGTGHKIINNIVVIDNNMTRSAISTNINTLNNPTALEVRNNIIYGTTGVIGTNPEIERIQINTQMVAPNFVNQSLYDFNLLSNSPAINSGFSASYVPTTDYYGNARSNADIGAIEYQTVLPLDLLYFGSQKTVEGNLLTWQTSPERQQHHFEIEYTTDLQQQQWKKIGYLKGNHNEQVNQTYRWLHHNFANTINYYRLKIVDYKRQYEYSKIVAIDNTNESNLKIYPNPATAILNMEFMSNQSESIDIQLFNNIGQQIYAAKIAAQRGNNLVNIPTHDFPIGLYTLYLKKGNNLEIRRVLIQ